MLCQAVDLFANIMLENSLCTSSMNYIISHSFHGDGHAMHILVHVLDYDFCGVSILGNAIVVLIIMRNLISCILMHAYSGSRSDSRLFFTC